MMINNIAKLFSSRLPLRLTESVLTGALAVILSCLCVQCVYKEEEEIRQRSMSEEELDCQAYETLSISL
jgi:hypothetical protein